MPPKQAKKIKYTQRKRGAKISTKMDGDGMDKSMDELSASSSSSDESSTDDELDAKTSKTPAKSKQQQYKKAAVTFESSTTSRKNKNTVGSKGESDSDDNLYTKKAASLLQKKPRRVKRKKPTTAKKVPPNKNTTKGRGSNGSNKKGNKKKDDDFIATSSNSDDEDDSTLSSGEDSSSSNKDSGEDDVYALDESDSAQLTNMKRLLLANTAMDAAYSALPADKKQTTSTITLVDNKFVKHADINNNENYNHRFITTIEDRLKNGGDPLYVILDGGDDNSQSGRVGLVCSFEDDDEKKVKVKFDVDGDGDGEMASYPITDLWHIFGCFNCGALPDGMDMDKFSDEDYTTCESCPNALCNKCLIEGGHHEHIVVEDDDGGHRLTSRCKCCILEQPTPKEARDEADNHIRHLIDEQIDDEYEEEYKRKKKKKSSTKKGGKIDDADDGNGNSDDEEETRTEPNLDELKAALSSRLLCTQHKIKAPDIRDTIKSLYPTGALDDGIQIASYLEDRELRALGQIHFSNLEGIANLNRFKTTSIAAIAEDAVPLLRLLHTQHCVEAECALCLDGKSRMGLDQTNLHKSKGVKQALALFKFTYGIAKANLAQSNTAKAKLKKKGEKLLVGTHVENFDYDPSMTCKDKCPACNHSYFQKCLTDQELAAEEKKKREDHADRVTDFDSMPAALKNNSTRPRYHGAVQKYKCACEDISGIYCQECEGEDPCCEVCLCECNIGPVTKNQFQAISRAAQSKAKGWKENEAVQTDQEKEASFGGVITNALANAASNLRRAGEEVNAQSLAGAAAIYVAESELEDNVQHHISTTMGKPTTKLNGTDVSVYQGLPASHRFYSNKLGAQSGRTGSSLLRQPAPSRTGFHTRVTSAPPPQQQQSAAVGAATAAAASAHPAVARDRGDEFEKRVVQAILYDGKTNPSSMRRKKRLLGDMSKSSEDGNVSKTIVNSYVNDETPEKGKSQEAYAMMLQFTKTPETNNDLND